MLGFTRGEVASAKPRHGSSSYKQNLRLGLGVCLLAFSVLGEPTTVTFAPELDGYVHINEKSTQFKGVIIADDCREGVMRLDVNGMENIESAKLRLYVTQHVDTDYCPIILRQMVDPDFREIEMTWNGLSHEFRSPSGLTPIMDPKDPRIIGYLSKVSALNEWQEFDITAAVKREAARTGKLAFIVSSMGWRGESSTPTCFAGSASDDATLRPQFVVTWPEGESRTDTSLWASCPCTDEFTAEKSGSTIRVDEYFLANAEREAYFKFDLSKIAGKGRGTVRRAMLKFGTYTFPNNATTEAYILSHDNVSWSQELDYPAGNRTKDLPNGTSSISTDVSKGVRFGATWQKNYPNEYEITRLVQEALDAGRDKITLSLVTRNNYAIGASHRNATIPGPELRVDMQLEGVDSAPPAWARLPQRTCETLSYATINNWSDRKTSSNSVKDGAASSQTGSSDGADKLKRVLHTFLLADPKGLENAPYVYLRIRQASVSAGSPYRRLFGCVTPKWNCENVAWDNLMREFDATVKTGNDPRLFDNTSTSYANHLSVFRHYIGNGEKSRTKYSPYLEYDVTELAHEAARKGEYLTFMLATSDNSGWIWYYTEKAAQANRPCLVYPTPCTFAEQISAAVGTSAVDGHKTAELSWTADPVAGTIYTVDRYDVKKEEWTRLADVMTEHSFVDAMARSDRDYLYRVTATHPDGTAAVATLTNRIDHTLTITNVLDGYVRNGNYKETAANWVESSLVMKDSGATDDGGTRESFVRFPLADVPSDTTKVTLRMRVGNFASYAYNEQLCFAVVPDVDKTDDDPPSWTSLLGSQTGSSPSSVEGLFYTRNLAHGCEPLVPSGVVDVDVTDRVRVAQTKGESHIFIHVWLKSPNHAMNFTFFTKESPYVESAPQLICERASWKERGMVVVFR